MVPNLDCVPVYANSHWMDQVLILHWHPLAFLRIPSSLDREVLLHLILEAHCCRDSKSASNSSGFLCADLPLCLYQGVVSSLSSHCGSGGTLYPSLSKGLVQAVMVAQAVSMAAGTSLGVVTCLT